MGTCFQGLYCQPIFKHEKEDGLLSFSLLVPVLTLSLYCCAVRVGNRVLSKWWQCGMETFLLSVSTSEVTSGFPNVDLRFLPFYDRFLGHTTPGRSIVRLVGQSVSLSVCLPIYHLSGFETGSHYASLTGLDTSYIKHIGFELIYLPMPPYAGTKGGCYHIFPSLVSSGEWSCWCMLLMKVGSVTYTWVTLDFLSWLRVCSVGIFHFRRRSTCRILTFCLVAVIFIHRFMYVYLERL